MKTKLNFVLQHHLFFLAVSLVFALPFLLGAPFVKTVDNVDYFTIDKNDDMQFYDQIKEVFGNDEFFLIAFKKPDIFTPDNLRMLQQITDEIDGIEEVREVKSLANIDDTIGDDASFEVRKFLESIPDDPESLAALKKSALNNPLYINNLISKDGTTAAIVVFTFKRDGDESYRRVLIDKCHEILNKYNEGKTDKTSFHIAGWTATNLYLSQYLKSDMGIFIPLTYVLITLCVYFIFRNIRLTLLALANISMCVGSTMGVFYHLGIQLNNVTTIVPPLIMALALCDTVHIFAHMERNVLVRFNNNKREALLHVISIVFVPCLMTTVTTALGFISLYISDIPPIRQFSITASCGMLFEFIFSFIFLPPMILLFGGEKAFIEYSEEKWVPGILGWMHDLTKKYARLIVLMTFVLVAGAIWQTTTIKVETNLLEFFKKSSPVRQALSWVEAELSGISTLDVSLKAEDDNAFLEPDNIKVIDAVQTFIKQWPGVDVVNSFADFIKDINQSFHNEDTAHYVIPDSGPLIAQYMLLYDSEDVNDYINEDYSHARIAARTHVYSSSEQREMIEGIKKFISTLDHPGLQIRVTGRAVSDVLVIDSLVNGQVSSLLLAAGIILGVMFLVLRSVSAGCLSIIPNLFPIILNFGIMGLFNVPLNTATSLISAVALGIAVDDTIHFLYEYIKQRQTGQSRDASLDRVITRKGRAILTSSVILCIGFGVMVFSKFIPIVNFGVLSAVIMMTALIGDLVILPAIIYVGPGSKKTKNI